MNRGGTSHFSRPAMGQSRLSPVYFVPGLFPGLFPRFISGLFRDKASRIVGTFRDLIAPSEDRVLFRLTAAGSLAA
jgi:hypothetical protein